MWLWRQRPRLCRAELSLWGHSVGDVGLLRLIIMFAMSAEIASMPHTVNSFGTCSSSIGSSSEESCGGSIVII